MYINKVTNQYPLSETQIRSENPQVSYSTPFNPGEPYEWVFPTPQPTYDLITQSVRETVPVKTVKGHYEQVWEIIPLSADQVVANQAAHVKRIEEEVVTNTQKRLDEFAKTRNYDGVLSACTYATSTVPKFKAEGQYAVNVRDNTWATLYQIMDDVQNGVRPVPTGYADIEPLLPALVWPA